MRGELLPAQYVESKLRALATFPEHKAKALAAIAVLLKSGKTEDAKTAAPMPLRQTVALTSGSGASMPEDLYDPDLHPMDSPSVSFEHLPEVRRKDPKAAKTAQKAPAAKAAGAATSKK